MVYWWIVSSSPSPSSFWLVGYNKIKVKSKKKCMKFLTHFIYFTQEIFPKKYDQWKLGVELPGYWLSINHDLNYKCIQMKVIQMCMLNMYYWKVNIYICMSMSINASAFTPYNNVFIWLQTIPYCQSVLQCLHMHCTVHTWWPIVIRQPCMNWV